MTDRSATKHTPGPWEAKFPLVLAADDRRTIVCDVTGAPQNKTAQADARLIAAAPDMLAALRAAARVFHVSVQEDGSTADHAARLVDAAIGKAEGRA